MPATRTKSKSPQQIGAQLREWRVEAGLTIDELAYELRDRAPRLRRASREYVRRYEVGDFLPERIDVPYLIVVLELLGHSPEELDEDVAGIVDDLRNVLLMDPTRAKARRGKVRTGSR